MPSNAAITDGSWINSPPIHVYPEPQPLTNITITGLTAMPVYQPIPFAAGPFADTNIVRYPDLTELYFLLGTANFQGVIEKIKQMKATLEELGEIVENHLPGVVAL